MLNEDLLPTSQSETEEKQVDFEREYLFVLHSIFGKICRFYKNDALSLSTKVTKSFLDHQVIPKLPKLPKSTSHCGKSPSPSSYRYHKSSSSSRKSTSPSSFKRSRSPYQSVSAHCGKSPSPSSYRYNKSSSSSRKSRSPSSSKRSTSRIFDRIFLTEYDRIFGDGPLHSAFVFFYKINFISAFCL